MALFLITGSIGGHRPVTICCFFLNNKHVRALSAPVALLFGHLNQPSKGDFWILWHGSAVLWWMQNHSTLFVQWR